MAYEKAVETMFNELTGRRKALFESSGQALFGTTWLSVSAEVCGAVPPDDDCSTLNLSRARS